MSNNVFNKQVQASNIRSIIVHSFNNCAAVMSLMFFKEDGLGGVYNEGGSEAMA
jgi:hypothetical protein